MPEAVILAEGLGKKYTIGHAAQRERYTALRDVIGRGLRTGLRKAGDFLHGRPVIEGDELEEIWALRDVGFKVKRGELLGVIGRNGAGKSTLLKILSRITEPTRGRVEIRGRVSSLLEVGTGFHPELTGRENVYLNGAILGMGRAEIRKKFDEIVAFAEIEKFLDTPVKRYSTGMYMRLAFSVAAHLEPDILVVDEVLAVGDAAFQKKCMGKMGEAATGARTVLFVSHNMAAISRLCHRTLWLEDGNLIADGDTGSVVSRYLAGAAQSGGHYAPAGGAANTGVEELKVFSVRVLNEDQAVVTNIDVRKPFFVEIRYRIYDALPYCRVGFVLSTPDGVVAFEAYDSDNGELVGRREPGSYMATCKVPENLLNTGAYVISANAGIPDVKNLVYLESILTINVEDTGAVGSSMPGEREGVVRPALEWTSREASDG